MSSAPRIILVVPCYNEASRLATEVFAGFVRERPEARLLFVDDGSTDDTAQVLATLERAGDGRIQVLSLDANRGKAEAVRAGMLAAFAEEPVYAGYWDADLSTPLEAVPLFESTLDAKPEVVLAMGSRVKLLGRDIRRSGLRHYVGRVFATAASVALRLPVYDTQCGAKLFRVTPTVRAAFKEPFLSHWVLDVEIIARLLRDRKGQTLAAREALFYEIVLTNWHEIAGSKVRPLDLPRALFALLRIHLRDIR